MKMEQQIHDLVFTYDKITVTIDASVRGDYSTAEVDTFKDYLQMLFTAWDDPYTLLVSNYINSKDEFKVYIKPLINDSYEVINDKEIIINSKNANNAIDLIDILYEAVSSANALYPPTEAKASNKEKVNQLSNRICLVFQVKSTVDLAVFDSHII